MHKPNNDTWKVVHCVPSPRGDHTHILVLAMCECGDDNCGFVSAVTANHVSTKEWIDLGQGVPNNG